RPREIPGPSEETQPSQVTFLARRATRSAGRPLSFTTFARAHRDISACRRPFAGRHTEISRDRTKIAQLVTSSFPFSALNALPSMGLAGELRRCHLLATFVSFSTRRISPSVLPRVAAALFRPLTRATD